MKYLVGAIGAALLVQPGAPAQAQAIGTDTPPEVFTKVVECRSIADAAARLACFDGAVAALSEAQKTKNVVVVSREDVRQARRGLFGFNFPKIRLFGGGDGADDEETESFDTLTSTIASVRQGQHGVVFSLPDGAIWEQTDKIYMGNVREGDTVTIESAALGSYLARIGTGRAGRVKRIR